MKIKFFSCSQNRMESRNPQKYKFISTRTCGRRLFSKLPFLNVQKVSRILSNTRVGEIEKSDIGRIRRIRICGTPKSWGIWLDCSLFYHRCMIIKFRWEILLFPNPHAVHIHKIKFHSIFIYQKNFLLKCEAIFFLKTQLANCTLKRVFFSHFNGTLCINIYISFI